MKKAERYVQYLGGKHPFTTRAERDKEETKAKKSGCKKYIIVDGPVVIAILNEQDCALIREDCGRAKDNQ